MGLTTRSVDAILGELVLVEWQIRTLRAFFDRLVERLIARGHLAALMLLIDLLMEGMAPLCDDQVRVRSTSCISGIPTLTSQLAA